MSNEAVLRAPAGAREFGGPGGGPWVATEARAHDASRPARGDAAKRALDAAGAALLIGFFLFAFVLIGAALLARHGRPVIFSHQRIGRDGVAFGCLKFRTMHRDADRLLDEALGRDPAAREEWRATQKLRRDPRVHGLGKLLRRSSLDELPQLFNVLAGNMSLVGPRPIVRREAVEYGSQIGCYLALRPGMTGLWQVSGRNNTTYAERVSLDERYFRDRSLWLDAKILARTVKVVLLARGAY